MFQIAKKISNLIPNKINLIRYQSSYNFNKSIIIYDYYNNLIKYFYDNSKNKNEEIYEIDYINNILTLKTNNAQSNEDFNKINNLIDFYKQKKNIIKLNHPNISKILINDALYYKKNILYIFDNLSIENYNLLDRLFNNTNNTNNNFLINSYKRIIIDPTIEWGFLFYGIFIKYG